jgi:hypothetical protein
LSRISIFIMNNSNKINFASFSIYVFKL